MVVARWPVALVALALTTACGDGDPGGDPDEGNTPILELPPRVARPCGVVSPATMIGDGLVNGFHLTTLGGRHHALTTRYDRTITLSELQLEPIALAAPSWSETVRDGSQGPVAALRETGGVALAWAEPEGGSIVLERVAVAILDDAGVQAGATTSVTSDRDIGSVSIVARPGGFALAWSAQTTMQEARLRVVLLDLDGRPVGEPTTVATAAGIGGQLVAHGTGFALAWWTWDSAATSLSWVPLDANGAPRTEPRRVPTREDRAHYGPFLASVGAELLLAWEEHYFPDALGDESGHAIVRVARLADDGAIAEPVLRLQAPEPGFVNVNPTFVRIDGAIALSWSRGDYIAVCGGCVSDNRMRFVLLDPVDLAPVSDVVELAGPAGLRSAPIATIDGRDFAYLLAIDRHARFDLAAAMVRCDPG